MTHLQQSAEIRFTVAERNIRNVKSLWVGIDGTLGLVTTVLYQYTESSKLISYNEQ